MIVLNQQISLNNQKQTRIIHASSMQQQLNRRSCKRTLRSLAGARRSHEYFTSANIRISTENSSNTAVAKIS
jgi:hypothetical protein